MATNKVTTNVIDMSGNTGGLVWAKGTKAQRPAGSTGDLRLNTTDTRLEYKDNADWKRFAETTAADPSVTVDYLVVAGGGGGCDNSIGGGGGAGGLRTSYGSTSGGGASAESSLTLALSTNYTVTVGAGGAYITNGSDSVFATITSTGGGHGRDTAIVGSAGGSGGGSGYNTSSTSSGTANQGFGGGPGNLSSSPAIGGGGGGAAEAGNTDAAGHGGDGVAVSITGASVTYAGGGGGSRNDSTVSPGGDGGGGSGATQGLPSSGTAATVNTGGGGGAGGGGTPTTGGAGGSGIVILRYPNTFTISVGSGLTSSTATDGGDKVTSFTAGTDTVSFS
tara:strand:+ start:510 stop:1514 length:1005 start_codon:yes stop_codon:yes gene_type:complete